MLGGSYHGHYGSKPVTTVTAAKGAAGHAILAGLTLPLKGKGSLYKTGPLKKGATCLLTGAIPGQQPEPIAWVNTYGPKKARIFYTSLGHKDDFANPAVVKLLTGAVRWTLALPAPKGT